MADPVWNTANAAHVEFSVTTSLTNETFNKLTRLLTVAPVEFSRVQDTDARVRDAIWS